MSAQRQTNFQRALADYDEKALRGVVDFDQHRYVSIERDDTTGETYVRGHRSLRAACDHMAGAIASDGLTPLNVLDLDSGELFELDVFTFVAPRSAQALAVLMPLQLAALTAANLPATPENQPAIEILKRAIDGRA